MLKKKKPENFALKAVFFLTSVLLISVGFLYVTLLLDGRATYRQDSEYVRAIVEKHPTFFSIVFNTIFSQALTCEKTSVQCIRDTRQRLDEASLTHGVLNSTTSPVEQMNQLPLYFITLLADGRIAKLFFSGDIVLEELNTREEKMVVDVLQGKRKTLYGPYFDSEIFKIVGNRRRLYDFKPSYLKDLYS